MSAIIGSAGAHAREKQEESLERGKFRTKGLKEGEDDVRVFFREPHNVRGRDRLLCFVGEHTVRPLSTRRLYPMPRRVHAARAAQPEANNPGLHAGREAHGLAPVACAHGWAEPIALPLPPPTQLQRYPFCVMYNDDKWNMEKRFSDFAELDKQLDEIYKGDSKVQLPEFPPKKMFGSLSPSLIVERKESLEQYMKALAKDPEILKCRVLREFIETPDVCSPEQHKEFDFGRR
mmetsp:Transcript_22263/g.56162  ORF Transcript_22263/g.56162 Transcript_22263/m.56162 type:complete len:233 (-) Transcript_22263:130-828(-)